MNKQEIEKAIEDIKDMQHEHRLYRSKIFEKDGIPLMYTESVSLAIQALEKQVPKRAEFAGGRYICRCGWDIYREEQCYCWSCGQKLDWEDDGE